MNNKKILTIIILSVFLIGMCIGAASAATHKVGTKKYNVKLTEKEYKKLTGYDVKYKTVKKTRTITVTKPVVKTRNITKVRNVTKIENVSRIKWVNETRNVTKTRPIIKTKNVTIYNKIMENFTFVDKYDIIYLKGKNKSIVRLEQYNKSSDIINNILKKYTPTNITSNWIMKSIKTGSQEFIKDENGTWYRNTMRYIFNNDDCNESYSSAIIIEEIYHSNHASIILLDDGYYLNLVPQEYIDEGYELYHNITYSEVWGESNLSIEITVPCGIKEINYTSYENYIVEEVYIAIERYIVEEPYIVEENYTVEEEYIINETYTIEENYTVKIPYKVRKNVTITKTIPNKYVKVGLKKYPIKMTITSNNNIKKGMVLIKIFGRHLPVSKHYVRIR